MPQALLPLIPDGATCISDRISIVQENLQWTYFYGVAPVFHHAQDDRTVLSHVHRSVGLSGSLPSALDGWSCGHDDRQNNGDQYQARDHRSRCSTARSVCGFLRIGTVLIAGRKTVLDHY